MSMGQSSHYQDFIGSPSHMGALRHIEDFDSSERLVVSAVALLKMLKHGKAGVPIEVMGLMLGRQIDKYSVELTDVFAMPQKGTGVNVEAIDDVFQVEYIELLQQVGITEPSIGWYHSHPGFGCWLSNVDISTHQVFEKVDPRSIALVVDPIQSVRGKVVIDAFRSIDHSNMFISKEPRLITSNESFARRPSVTALVRGLNKFYYSIIIEFSVTELQTKMLRRIISESWVDRLSYKLRGKGKKVIERKGSSIRRAGGKEEREKKVNEQVEMWRSREQKERKMKDEEEVRISRVGKINPVRRLFEIFEEESRQMEDEEVRALRLGSLFGNPFARREYGKMVGEVKSK